MILTSLKPATELVEFAFLPKNPTLANYAEVLSTNNFGRWYFNSILIAVISTASVAFFDTLVGYTFNKFEFPGKKHHLHRHPGDADGADRDADHSLVQHERAGWAGIRGRRSIGASSFPA
jgi:hypothetical protein